MEKILLKGMTLFSMIILTITSVSCTKEQRDKLEGKANVTVYLKDSDGSPLSDWVIYAYDNFAWRNNSTFHAKQSATDTEGKATFSLNVNLSDGQEVYHFVVYYTESRRNLLGNEISKRSLQKEKPVTLKRGENQTITINL